MTKLLAAALAAAFVACIVVTNIVTALLPNIPVGFGQTATAGTLLAGLSFVIRDAVQDAVRRSLPTPDRWLAAAPVFLLVLAGAAVSYGLSVPALALASGAAFLLAESFDLLIYTPLRDKGYIRAAVASNIVAAVVDTFVFLYLAQSVLRSFDPTFTVAGAVPGQLIGKLLVTGVTVGLVWLARRAVTSDRERSLETVAA